MASSSGQSKSPFVTDYDKRGQAACKRCKQKFAKGTFRIGKLAPNPFSDSGGELKQWFHPNCIFESFARGRSTSAKITKLDDVAGYQQLGSSDREALEKLILGVNKSPLSSAKSPKKASPAKPIGTFFPPVQSPEKKPDSTASSICADSLFSTFCTLCNQIAGEASYKSKTAVVENFIFRSGATKKHPYCGNLYTLLRLLLPGEKGLDRVYNLNNKQLVKIYADIFHEDAETISSALNENGDISDVIANYFAKSQSVKPVKTCLLTLADADQFLDSLTVISKYDEQLASLRKFTRSCGVMELRYAIRLVKKDMRMNAKARHILDALGSTTYEAFQASRDLKAICSAVQKQSDPNSPSPTLKKQLSIKTNLLTPVQPMLAEACRSIEFAFGRCSRGMLAEIKLDGERLQLHKRDKVFSYFSRSLKPVQQHKVNYLSNAIPKAFPGASDLIIDGEIVLVDTTSHLPLPFGTLGVHKAAAFSKAQVCLFVFDCLYMNGQSLMTKTITERRDMLLKHMVEIPDRVVLSEAHHVTKTNQLQTLLEHVFTEGLEGLVLKPVESTYEPGKRHWLKMKKDYLSGGAMADSADLIVLGAYFGTGNKGGMMSVFLMGVYDSNRKKFVTVTKCGNGLDDAKLAKLQKELDMVRVNKDAAQIPDWLIVKSQLLPDFIVRNPQKSQIWEVTGAEFSKADIHTADGISIRFPRVTKIRDDKDWKSATSLEELKKLFNNSKQQAPKQFKQLTNSGSAKKKPQEKTAKTVQKRESDVTSKSAKRKLFVKDDSDSDSDFTIDCDDDKDCPPSTSTATIPSRSSSSLLKSPKKKSKLGSPASEKPSSPETDWYPSDIFTSCHFYFDEGSIKDLKLRNSLFRSATAYNAASICSSPTDPKITHFIMSDSCLTKPLSASQTATCLKLSWVLQCVKTKALVDASLYEIGK